MIADAGAFEKVCGITYAPQLFQRGPGQVVGGLRLKASSDMYAEREIIFDTIGCARLKNREDEPKIALDPSGNRV